MEDTEDDDELMRKRRKSPPRAQLPPKSALNLVRALQSTGGDGDDDDGNRSGFDADEDLDGVPMEEDIDGVPMGTLNNNAFSSAIGRRNELQPGAAKVGGFVPSKWETVDPEEVKAGAVTTTSKWDLFEDTGSNQGKDEPEGNNSKGGNGGLVAAYDDNDEEEEDIDGRPMDEDDEDDDLDGVQQQQQLGSQQMQFLRDSDRDYPYGTPNSGSGRNIAYAQQEEDISLEERRLKLREVELKVLAFQDDLESGRKVTKHGMSVQDTVQKFREKLLRRVS
jgi:hypothetical protein